MKNVVKMASAASMMAGAASMMAVLVACGGVQPEVGYDVRVAVEQSEGEGNLVSKITVLDSLGDVVAEDEVETSELAPGLDVNEILKKLRVEMRLDGPPDFSPEPDPMKLTSQTLVSDGWGRFSGQIVKQIDTDMALEVTISLDNGDGEELYDMAYLPIHDAMSAGMAVQEEVETEENVYEANYRPIHNAANAGMQVNSAAQSQ